MNLMDFFLNLMDPHFMLLVSARLSGELANLDSQAMRTRVQPRLQAHPFASPMQEPQTPRSRPRTSMKISMKDMDEFEGR